MSRALHFLEPLQNQLRAARANEGYGIVAITLVAITRFHGNSFTTFSAAAGKYGLAALGFHTGTEAVRLGTVTAVRLKRALRH